MSTASRLETMNPGYCTGGGTSSTTLVFLKVTLMMTLKVKIHTCIVNESCYANRLASDCLMLFQSIFTQLLKAA